MPCVAGSSASRELIYADDDCCSKTHKFNDDSETNKKNIRGT